MSEFQPGQFVICVNDTFPQWLPPCALPVKGCIYTVHRVIPPQLPVNPFWGVTLRELENEPVMYQGRVSFVFFPQFHFRAVRETSIEVFYRILDPVAEKKHD